MFKNTFSLFLIVFCAMPFTSMAQKTTDKKAKDIIQRCVAVHGGKNYQNLNISFDFRKYKFKIKNNGSLFEYERTTQDSVNNTVRDVLNNAGFARDINGQKQTLSAKEESISLNCGIPEAASVLIGPAEIAFTLMPNSPKSAAR